MTMRTSTKLKMKGRADRIRGRALRALGTVTGDAVQRLRGSMRKGLGSARITAGKGAARARMRMRPIRRRMKDLGG